MVFLSGTMQCQSVCAISIPWCQFGVNFRMGNTLASNSLPWNVPDIYASKFSVFVKNKKQQWNTDWMVYFSYQTTEGDRVLCNQSCIHIAKLFDLIEVLYTTTMQVKPINGPLNIENMTSRFLSHVWSYL